MRVVGSCRRLQGSGPPPFLLLERPFSQKQALENHEHEVCHFSTLFLSLQDCIFNNLECVNKMGRPDIPTACFSIFKKNVAIHENAVQSCDNENRTKLCRTRSSAAQPCIIWADNISKKCKGKFKSFFEFNMREVRKLKRIMK